jgi:hypothetical protein
MLDEVSVHAKRSQVDGLAVIGPQWPRSVVGPELQDSHSRSLTPPWGASGENALTCGCPSTLMPCVLLTRRSGLWTCNDAAMVDIEAQDNGVILRLTRDEATRLSLAISAGYETTSRTEYYIRYGLSLPEVRNLADTIEHVATTGEGGRSVPLASGVEQAENPRRPRP